MEEESLGEVIRTGKFLSVGVDERTEQVAVRVRILMTGIRRELHFLIYTKWTRDGARVIRRTMVTNNATQTESLVHACCKKRL
jgi:hypothetical protein